MKIFLFYSEIGERKNKKIEWQNLFFFIFLQDACNVLY